MAEQFFKFNLCVPVLSVVLMKKTETYNEYSFFAGKSKEQLSIAEYLPGCFSGHNFLPLFEPDIQPVIGYILTIRIGNKAMPLF